MVMTIIMISADILGQFLETELSAIRYCLLHQSSSLCVPRVLLQPDRMSSVPNVSNADVQATSGASGAPSKRLRVKSCLTPSNSTGSLRSVSLTSQTRWEHLNQRMRQSCRTGFQSHKGGRSSGSGQKKEKRCSTKQWYYFVRQ